MKKVFEKVRRIVLEAMPIALMLALLYVVSSEHLLTLLFIAVIAVAFMVRYERLDATALVLGIIVMTVSELYFVGSGVETFTQASLFGVMPIWLPILWGYGFVVIKRAVVILR